MFLWKQERLATVPWCLLRDPRTLEVLFHLVDSVGAAEPAQAGYKSQGMGRKKVQISPQKASVNVFQKLEAPKKCGHVYSFTVSKRTRQNSLGKLCLEHQASWTYWNLLILGSFQKFVLKK